MILQVLQGKNGVVVGASQGIGLAIAKKFVEQGANIIMTARGKEKLEKACAEVNAQDVTGKGKAICVTADICSPEDANMVMDLCVKEFGKLDFLVNNAAIGEMQTIEAVAPDRISEILETNIKGPMVYIQAALKYMVPQDSGSILNVSSNNGLRPLCGATYTTSKGGLNTLTENVATYLVGRNLHIRINALCPGNTATPTAHSHTVGKTTLAEGSMWEIRNSHSVHTPIIVSQPEEQATAALFLISDLGAVCQGTVLRADKGAYL